MLDEIGTASRAIDTRCKLLEVQMNHVAEQSKQQQASAEGVAAATEEFSQSLQEVASNVQDTAAAEPMLTSRQLDALIASFELYRN